MRTRLAPHQPRLATVPCNRHQSPICFYWPGALVCVQTSNLLENKPPEVVGARRSGWLLAWESRSCRDGWAAASLLNGTQSSDMYGRVAAFVMCVAQEALLGRRSNLTQLASPLVFQREATAQGSG
jgi:hypothetical protein